MNDQQTGHWNGQGLENHNNTSNEVSTERENIYVSLITSCFREIDQIHGKISIFSCEMNQVESVETPTRTELESQLKRLLISLKYLKESIVV